MYKLDAKDKRILQELDRNARQSSAEIAKRTGFSKQAVSYRINSLVKGGVVKQFVSFIDCQRLGFSFYFVLLKMRNWTKTDEKRAVEKLVSMPEVSWLASLRGEWRLLVCTIVKDTHGFNRALDRVLSVIREKVVGYEFFILLEAYQLPYKKVLGAPQDAYSWQTSIGKERQADLKETDTTVLGRLAVDARMPKKEIAEQTGLTLEMVRHSMRKLERSGIIQAYKPLIDVSKAGYSWHLMLLQFNYSSEQKKEEFVNYLKNLEQVFYINKGVGNWSLAVEFHTKTLEEFSELHDSIRSRFEALIADETVVQVLKEHKCVFFPVEGMH